VFLTIGALFPLRPGSNQPSRMPHPTHAPLGFWKSGHWPTLLCAFLYFDLAFMVWVMLGPMAVQIANDLKLTPAQSGLMVALPVLSGALLRIVMGILVDHIGPKRAGAIGQVLVIIALAAAAIIGVSSYQGVLLLGLFLGVAGASFAAALPLASRWYPPEHQGTALGLAGAGNSGTVLAALLAPGLAIWVGWQSVFGLALIALIPCLVFYMLVAKDSPEIPPPKPLRAYLDVLQDADAWWFMFFYLVSFGGFVGLAASLTLYFHAQYGLDELTAAYFTAVCVFAGSMFRPIGGALADRKGGIRTLYWMYSIALVAIIIVSFGLQSQWLALMVFGVATLALGMANGAVFQLVPQRFRKEIGVMTGLIGMAGGLGGFCLASSLGISKQWTGSYQLGLLVFAALTLMALIGLAVVEARWRNAWGLGAAKV
jgi:MFS transporter, NNP family, nitrate/nitrite transporter